jgi:hypothetical protein
VSTAVYEPVYFAISDGLNFVLLQLLHVAVGGIDLPKPMLLICIIGKMIHKILTFKLSIVHAVSHLDVYQLR